MGVPYYGDFPEDAMVYIPFNTFSSDDPSASVTITNLADTDIYYHKDGSTTDYTADAATLVSIDFDTITGNHMLAVDTSENAYFSTGSEFSIRMEGTTVDGATVNAFIGSFSIERAGGAIALLKTAQADLDLITGADGTILATAQGNYAPNVVVPPSVAEFEARSIVSADYTIVADLGTVQTADHTAGIADIPTVAEFNARTIVSADYVVVGDTIAGVTLTATTTAVTNDVGITQAAADKVWGTAARTLTASTNFNDVSTADVLAQCLAALDTAYTDGDSPTANGMRERLRVLSWILRNKIAVTDASGNTIIYKDDSTTTAFSVNAMLTDDSTTTTRLRAA